MSEQCELLISELPQNLVLSNSVKGPVRRQGCDSKIKPKYLTTNDVVERLRLDSPYPLRKSRSNGCAYRSDRYIAVPVGRNRWELFQKIVS